MYVLFDIIICIDFILSIAIIVINKYDINDTENNKNINFKAYDSFSASHSILTK